MKSEITDQILEVCAHAAHEAHRAFCRSIGDLTEVPWDEAPHRVKVATYFAVRSVLAGEFGSELHERWAKARVAAGWTYGPELLVAEKKDPYLLPYNDLLPLVRKKGFLVGRVIWATAIGLGWLNGNDLPIPPLPNSNDPLPYRRQGWPPAGEPSEAARVSPGASPAASSEPGEPARPAPVLAEGVPILAYMPLVEGERQRQVLENVLSNPLKLSDLIQALPAAGGLPSKQVFELGTESVPFDPRSVPLPPGVSHAPEGVPYLPGRTGPLPIEIQPAAGLSFGSFCTHCQVRHQISTKCPWQTRDEG